MTSDPTRSPSELADALEARAQHTLATILLDELDDEAAAEAAKSAELDYEAARSFRAMDEALAEIASWPCLGDNHNPMKPAVDGMREAARTARGES